MNGSSAPAKEEEEPMDVSAAHTENYQTLVDAGLPQKVAESLDNIFQTGWLVQELQIIQKPRCSGTCYVSVGLVEYADLDERAIDALREFNEEGALTVLQQFKESDLSHVQVAPRYGRATRSLSSRLMSPVAGCLLFYAEQKRVSLWSHEDLQTAGKAGQQGAGVQQGPRRGQNKGTRPGMKMLMEFGVAVQSECWCFVCSFSCELCFRLCWSGQATPWMSLRGRESMEAHLLTMCSQEHTQELELRCRHLPLFGFWATQPFCSEIYGLSSSSGVCWENPPGFVRRRAGATL